MFRNLAPARRRLMLGLLAVALVAIAAAGFAVASTNTSEGHPHAATSVRQEVPGPVIIVPGYGGSTTGPDRLADALRSRGKAVSVLTLPDNGQGDLETQARALGAAVDRLRQRTGAATVDVVGYSAGGVVARLWVRDQGGEDAARRVVTLGSPHHGTELASLGGVLSPADCPTACQQLQPGSALLGRLNAGDETPPGPRFVSIWTTADEVVLPPDSARLAGALDVTVQSLCPNDRVGHSDLPGDPVVQQLVAAALAATPLRTPSVTC